MSAAEIINLEEQFTEFKKDLAKQYDRIECLTAGTPFSVKEHKVNFDMTKDFRKQTEEPPFWANFKEIAPLIFCFALEKDQDVSGVRDSWVTNEIMHTKAVLKHMYNNIDSVNPKDVNMHYLSTSLKTLQEKINVIKSLKAPPMDPEHLKIKIFGTNKRLILNINKLHEAVSFEEILTEEQQKKEEDRAKSKPKPKFGISMPPEDHKYLAQTMQGFRVTETKDGILQKHSMIQLLKFIGDFAKSKNQDVSKEAQGKRLEHYGKDDNKYIEAIQHTLIKEENNYNYWTKAILQRLHVSQETFLKSEQALFSDPLVQIELMKNIKYDDFDDIEIPDLLDKETAIEIIKKANDVAFSKYKDIHEDVLNVDPNLTPVVITCLSHDYILDVYAYTELTFKAVIQKFKVFDDPELNAFIQDKQMELMQI